MLAQRATSWTCSCLLPSNFKFPPGYADCEKPSCGGKASKHVRIEILRTARLLSLIFTFMAKWTRWIFIDCQRMAKRSPPSSPSRDPVRQPILLVSLFLDSLLSFTPPPTPPRAPLPRASSSSSPFAYLPCLKPAASAFSHSTVAAVNHCVTANYHTCHRTLSGCKIRSVSFPPPRSSCSPNGLSRFPHSFVSHLVTVLLFLPLSVISRVVTP